MKKLIAFIIAAMMIASALAACGKTDDPNKTKTTETTTETQKKEEPPKPVTLTPAEIEARIKAAIGEENYICNTKIEEDWFSSYYGFDMTQIKSFVALENAVSAVNPDMVIIMEVKDGYAQTAVNILNERFEGKVGYIRQYPFGVQKVLGARLFTEGNYVAFIIAGASYEGENTEEEAKLAAAEYAKIDNAWEAIFGKKPHNLAIIPEDKGNGGGGLFPSGDEDIPVIGG